uniref:Sulfotransferase n=1 Tax=Desulfomonile tiedjei TaxID=2358 RepID=A0A7C4AQ53_9BACT
MSMSALVRKSPSIKKGPQALQGMKVGALLKVLARNDFAVDVQCLGRLAHLLVLGVFNSVFGAAETLFNGRKIRCSHIDHPILFIIGHWRSGTTHLENLLTLDSRFSYATAYQTMFPHHCLYTQNAHFVFDRIAPKKRPMDNVSFAAKAPHEDEFALAASATISPYMRFLFPVTGDPGYSEIDMSKWSPEMRETWKDCFLEFLRKLTLSQDGRILLKSPPHLGRVAALVEMFPDAQFVHIVRNPYAVFSSTRKLWLNTLAFSHLQIPDPEHIEELIFTWYIKLFELFERDRALIPDGAFFELKFEELEAQPVATLKRLYEALSIPGFDDFEPSLKAYLDSIKNYQKNVHELDPATKAKIARRWGFNFQRYGYEI